MAGLHNEDDAFNPKDADFATAQLARTSKLSGALAFDAHNPMDLQHSPGAHLNAAMAGGEPSSYVPKNSGLSMDAPEPLPSLDDGAYDGRSAKNLRMRHPTMPTHPPEKYRMPTDDTKKKNTYVPDSKEDTRVEIDPRELPYMAQIAMTERDQMAAELTAKKARVAFQEDYIQSVHHRQDVADGVIAALNQKLAEAGAPVDLSAVVAEVEAAVAAKQAQSSPA